MPCLIKSPTDESPGIVTFTYNEIISPLFKEKTIDNFLEKQNKWIFGVHLQGSYERLVKFPHKNWQDFIMCYSTQSKYLENIESNKKIDISCSNFVKTFDCEINKKFWEICVISRDAEIKRIDYTVKLIKKLVQKKKDIRILVIIPDSRPFYKKLFISSLFKKSYFHLIKKLLKNEERKKIDFISSDTSIFGNFPLTEETIHRFLSQSKFLMLNSKKEGINRSIIEAFSYGAKVIVNSDLESEIVDLFLNEKNTIFINDDIETSSNKIIESINKFSIPYENREHFKKFFSDISSKERLKKYLEELLISKSHKVNGNWFLENLNLRLCGHGNFNNFQFFYNKNIFFDWFDKAAKVDNSFLEEDNFYNYIVNDKPNWRQLLIIIISKLNVFFKKFIKFQLSLFK